ncbi:MAG: hypothetical protein KJO64_00900 [Bacteroidia bacterium]|nr:hypothetical protein [Bacteroidia bacterium]NNC86683.1 hypothetical protein [Bacteroidia bacterium]
MKGFHFSQFIPTEGATPFENLHKLFMQLLNYTSGDVQEALGWMNEIDRKHSITNNDYGMADFIDDLKKNGYIKEDGNEHFSLTAKSEQTIRKNALNEIFGKLRKTSSGNHKTVYTGNGDDVSTDSKKFEYGDSISNINPTQSIRNAQLNHGLDDFRLTEDDLEIQEQEHKSHHSTVLMIDISHSMILYGEDRITPAKKVAMALAELIRIKYPKDTLDVLTFGNEAKPIQVKDLPYLTVGPYHTNTTAGLELAMDILRRRKTPNKQIFMITDGKPSCIKEGARFYKNSIGLDRKIVSKTLNMAAQCRRLNIPITTFMIASDPYLKQFVREFTEINNGRAFYSSLSGLGEYIFEDFIKNRRKTIR